MRSVVLGIVCVLVGTARADSDAQRATVLFNDGQVLRKQGRLVDACDKFEQSYQLDPAIGTELNVADCREREGKLAEAYQLFDHASQNDKRADRAKYARARADSIRKLLAKHDAAATEPPPDPPPDEEPGRDPEPKQIEQSRADDSSPAPAPAETEHPPTAWRVAFAGSVTVLAIGVGLIIYGHHEITDATQKLCDGNGYSPQDRLDLCTSQATGPSLTPAQVDTLNRQGEQGRNLVIGGELAAVIGGGFAALGLYEGFIAKRPKARTTSVSIAPYVSPSGGGATIGWAW